MKNTHIAHLALLTGAALTALSYAGELTDTAVATAQDSKASTESIALATVAAVKGDTEVTPSQVLTNVLSSRTQWTSAQVGYLYKSVLIASGLNSSLARDLRSFKNGNTTSSEGTKLLAVATAAGYDLTTLEDTLGEVTPSGAAPAVMSTNTARATRTAKFPVQPAPPVVSPDN